MRATYSQSKTFEVLNAALKAAEEDKRLKDKAVERVSGDLDAKVLQAQWAGETVAELELAIDSLAEHGVFGERDKEGES